ncbi:MAG TPA: PCRF domain-containing protein, partial [Clostridia bacterium]|nr:PCRF domain-containing protein [Clostridia bacterium]
MLKKLEEMEARYEELTEKLAQPEIIANQEEWQKFSKEHSALSQTVMAFREYRDVLEKLNQALENKDYFKDDPDLFKLAEQEIEDLENKKEKLEETLKEMLAPRDPDEDKNVILEIRAGAGGDEAALFAADLMRMYMRFCERNNCKFDTVSITTNDLGGLKEGIFTVAGPKIFKKLKYESGVHRVQRIPVTESGGRIHTSTA